MNRKIEEIELKLRAHHQQQQQQRHITANALGSHTMLSGSAVNVMAAHAAAAAAAAVSATAVTGSGRLGMMGGGPRGHFVSLINLRSCFIILHPIVLSYGSA